MTNYEYYEYYQVQNQLHVMNNENMQRQGLKQGSIAGWLLWESAIHELLANLDHLQLLLNL